MASCNLYTLAYDVRLRIVGNNELKSAQQSKQGVFMSGYKWSTTHIVLKSGKTKIPTWALLESGQLEFSSNIKLKL